MSRSAEPRRTSGVRGQSGSRRQRGVVAGLVRLLVFAALVSSIVVGTLLFAPTALDGIDPLNPGDELLPSSGDPSPSADEPPPAGERSPDPAHPDDPGESSYETAAESVTASAVEDAIHAEVTDRRAERGLDPIARDETIASVARAHSADMADREYFNHTTPGGQGPFDRFSDVGDYCRAYGENLALSRLGVPLEAPDGGDAVEHRTATELAVGLVEQWMHSPGHREAILEERWDRSGVGVYLTDEGDAYATHNFCTVR